MQRKEISEWMVLTLSAEQAARDGDYEHLSLLMDRRDTVLSEWEAIQFELSEKEIALVAEPEHRLQNAMESVCTSLGQDIQKQSSRSKAVKAYRSA